MPRYMKVQNPDEVEMTLTISYKIRDWKRIKDNLSRSTVASEDFFFEIRCMIEKAEQAFYPDEKEEI